MTRHKWNKNGRSEAVALPLLLAHICMRQPSPDWQLASTNQHAPSTRTTGRNFPVPGETGRRERAPACVYHQKRGAEGWTDTRFYSPQPAERSALKSRVESNSTSHTLSNKATIHVELNLSKTPRFWSSSTRKSGKEYIMRFKQGISFSPVSASLSRFRDSCASFLRGDFNSEPMQRSYCMRS